MARAIGHQPIMDHAGTNVKLSISSTSLSLRAHDSGQLIATHDMPRISFASGGDTVSLNCFFFFVRNSILYLSLFYLLIIYFCHYSDKLL